MTCAYPLHPSDPSGARCGKPATAMRRPVKGLAPAPLCAEHAATYERARGYGPTPEEDALTQALNEDADEAAAMGPALRASRKRGGP